MTSGQPQTRVYSMRPKPTAPPGLERPGGMFILVRQLLPVWPWKRKDALSVTVTFYWFRLVDGEKERAF